jgi:hypothetical protein
MLRIFYHPQFTQDYGTHPINRSYPRRRPMPLMILGHRQNAGRH